MSGAISRFKYCAALLALIGALVAESANAQTAPPETIVVTAAHLIDVRDGSLRADPRLTISGGRIQSIEFGAPAAAIADDVRHVDMSGMTLVPGLIDMHVHLDSDPTYGGYSGLQFNDRFWSMLAVPHAAATLEAGFTTVRNVGSDAWNDVGLREAIDAGKIPGPRVVPAANSFGATGGHCDSTYFPPSMQQKNPFNADSPAEGRQRVRELRKYGARVIKICATGGVFSRNTEPGQQQLSLEEMQAIVAEAHQWGLKVAAHAHGAAGIKDAIRAGVDTIEHASLIDEQGIALAVERGAWLSMDIYNTDYTQAEGARNGVLEDNLRKDREIAEIQREGFRRAVKAGARMVFGSDAGVFPHGLNARQFAVMVRYGMTPLQALQSATVNAAQALGRDDVGVLEVGRWADVVAVPGDPLRDVALLETPRWVMKGGEVVLAPGADGR